MSKPLDIINAKQELLSLPNIKLFDGAYIKYIWQNDYRRLKIKSKAFANYQFDNLLDYIDFQYNNFTYAQSNSFFLSGFILLKNDSWYERKIVGYYKEVWSLVTKPSLAPYVMDF